MFKPLALTNFTFMYQHVTLVKALSEIIRSYTVALVMCNRLEKVIQ